MNKNLVSVTVPRIIRVLRLKLLESFTYFVFNINIVLCLQSLFKKFFSKGNPIWPKSLLEDAGLLGCGAKILRQHTDEVGRVITSFVEVYDCEADVTFGDVVLGSARFYYVYFGLHTGLI